MTTSELEAVAVWVRTTCLVGVVLLLVSFPARAIWSAVAHLTAGLS